MLFELLSFLNSTMFKLQVVLLQMIKSPKVAKGKGFYLFLIFVKSFKLGSDRPCLTYFKSLLKKKIKFDTLTKLSLISLDKHY